MQPADHDPWINEESKVVSKYDETGWLNDLPPLLAAIRDHACSYFEDADGTKVDNDNYNCALIIVRHCSSLVVNGVSPQLNCWWGLQQPGSILARSQLLTINFVESTLTTEY